MAGWPHRYRQRGRRAARRDGFQQARDVERVFPGDFSSTLDWDTGINLPVLFRGSWKFQPVLGIANAAAGQPFMLRNRNTNGDWVQQSKRFRFGVSSSPTLFAFFLEADSHARRTCRCCRHR